MTAPPLHPPARDRSPRRSLGAALAGRDNALNFVRLVLASSVIIGHTWPLGGFGSSAWEGISGAAVNGFFVISGYLVAGSRVRGAFAPYLWRRALRILPAFWVCLLLVAFVFAPVSLLFTGGSYDLGSALAYVGRNAGLWISQWGVDGTLENVPYAGAWNGSLWTLAYEFAAYLAAGALLTLPFVRRRPVPWIALALAALLIVQVFARGPLDVTTNIYLHIMRLGGFFFAGMLLWALRDRLRVSALWGVLSIVTVVMCSQLPEPFYYSLAAVPMAYAMLWLGAALPVRVGAVNDISYGIYIYAFPVQQLLAAAGAPGMLGFWGYAVVAWLLTLPLAWASWTLVERPAMRWKYLVPGSKPLEGAGYLHVAREGHHLAQRHAAVE